MKKILLGISFILFGIMCLMISWMSGYRMIDLLGIGLSIVGLCLSIVGFSNNE